LSLETLLEREWVNGSKSAREAKRDKKDIRDQENFTFLKGQGRQ
jgi:hypothetical protein